MEVRLSTTNSGFDRRRRGPVFAALRDKPIDAVRRDVAGETVIAEVVARVLERRVMLTGPAIRGEPVEVHLRDVLERGLVGVRPDVCTRNDLADALLQQVFRMARRQRSGALADLFAVVRVPDPKDQRPASDPRLVQNGREINSRRQFFPFSFHQYSPPS